MASEKRRSTNRYLQEPHKLCPRRQNPSHVSGKSEVFKPAKESCLEKSEQRPVISCLVVVLPTGHEMLNPVVARVLSGCQLLRVGSAVRVAQVVCPAPQELPHGPETCNKEAVVLRLETGPEEKAVLLKILPSRFVNPVGPALSNDKETPA